MRKEKNAEIIISSNYDHLFFAGVKENELHAMTQSDDLKELAYMFRAVVRKELQEKGFSHVVKWGGILMALADGLTSDYKLRAEMEQFVEIINNVTDKLHDKMQNDEN